MSKDALHGGSAIMSKLGGGVAEVAEAELPKQRARTATRATTAGAAGRHLATWHQWGLRPLARGFHEPLGWGLPQRLSTLGARAATSAIAQKRRRSTWSYATTLRRSPRQWQQC